MTDQELLDLIGIRLNKLSQRFAKGTFIISSWNAQNIATLRRYLAVCSNAGITEPHIISETLLDLLFLNRYRISNGQNLFLPVLFHDQAMQHAIARLNASPEDPFIPTEKFIWNKLPRSVKKGAPEGGDYFFKYSFDEVRNFAYNQTLQAVARHNLDLFQNGKLMPSAYLLQVVDRMFFCLLGNNYMQEASGRPDERLMATETELNAWFDFHTFLQAAVRRQEAENLLELFGYFETEKKIGKGVFNLCELLLINQRLAANDVGFITGVMNLIRPSYVQNSVEVLARRIDGAIKELQDQVAPEEWGVFGPVLLETERPKSRTSFNGG